jgi:hypothetical protein
MKPYLLWAYRWRCRSCQSDYDVRLAEGNENLLVFTALTPLASVRTMGSLVDLERYRQHIYRS